jgi:esterase/lipase superfamily enzyme
MKHHFKHAFIHGILILMSLSACSTVSPDMTLSQNKPIALTVYGITSRTPDTPQNQIFSGDRDEKIHLVRHGVSIPAARDEGTVSIAENESNSVLGQHFTTLSTQTFSDARTFAQKLNQERGKKRVTLFIHGYNNRYRDALYRLAQVHHDAGLESVPVLFSFASRGKLRDYAYDEDSASMARSSLSHMIEQLLLTTRGELDIVAHSMGNWLTVEALKELRLRRGENGVPRIGTVILASPDIDADVFSTQWPLIKTLAHQTLLVCNPHDKALKASTKIGGEKPRLGNLDPCVKTVEERFSGLKAIDVSPFDESSSDRLRHNPGANTVLIERFAALMKRGGQLTKPNADNIAENVGAATAGLVEGVIGVIPRVAGQGISR